jgi:hypothetical protein
MFSSAQPYTESSSTSDGTDSLNTFVYRFSSPLSYTKTPSASESSDVLVLELVLVPGANKDSTMFEDLQTRWGHDDDLGKLA